MCGAGDVKLLICGACLKHGYCSEACQRRLWKHHKPLCRRIAAVIAKASQAAARDRALPALEGHTQTSAALSGMTL